MQPIIKQKLNLQFILKTFKKTLNYIFEVVQSLFITTSRPIILNMMILRSNLLFTMIPLHSNNNNNNNNNKRR